MYASGRLLANPLQQFEIGDEAASARLDRAVVLDLPGHEDVAAIARGPIDPALRLAIFADAGLDDQPAQFARTAEQFVIERRPLQQAFEFAWARWIEMRPKRGPR